MSLVLLICALLVLIFGFVVFYGAPYLPSKKPQITTALELLNLKRGQRILDLGAGDGKMVVEALKYGYKVTAIELNPILCMIIYCRTWPYRQNTRVIWGNYWEVDWGDYDGVYVFLLDKYMKKLDDHISQQNKKVKLASFAFKIPGRKIIVERNGVYLYQYITATRKSLSC